MRFNKKAFTLVEVIGVITILSLMLLVTVPALTKTLKRNEQKKYDAYIDNLKIVSETYVVKQLKEGIVIGDEYYITLGDLIDSGYVENTIVNPENENKLSRETKIKVSKNLDGSFKYDVKEHYILPDDYTLVEYIESTAVQYVNTDVLPNQNTGFDITYKSLDSIGNDAYGTILGSKTSTSNFELTTYTNDSDLLGTFRYGNGEYNAGLTTELMHVTLKNQKYTNNDNVEISLNKEFQLSSELTIFGLNDGGTVTNKGKVQLYSLKLYDGNDLIRDFVPCYRKSDGTIGLYDLANARFYTNNGSGSFLKGEDAEQ